MCTDLWKNTRYFESCITIRWKTFNTNDIFMEVY
jgi:hypothetical protein